MTPTNESDTFDIGGDLVPSERRSAGGDGEFANGEVTVLDRGGHAVCSDVAVLDCDTLERRLQWIRGQFDGFHPQYRDAQYPP